MILRGNWNYPTPIRFGPGRVAELPAACAELGIQRPLLITDRGLANNPLCDRVLAILRDAGLDAWVFSDLRPNPTGGDVEAGVRALKVGGHDGVVALGGGSALDAAKAIALMWGQTLPLWDFEDKGDNYTRIDPAGMLPVIAIPTTAGTGSEVGRASVILDERTHVKKIIFHPKMLPARVIADPELTFGLPAHLTAATGIDALSHCLEAWCAPGWHPLADGIAAEGIRLIHQYLLRAMHHGDDVEARSGMLAASLMGATAFQKGLGAMHSIAHVVGAHTDAHHGLLNAIVMPYVLRYNRPVIEDRIALLAGSMGLAPTFDAFLEWVLTLGAATQIPSSLSAVGVTLEDVPAYARESQDDASTGTNPTPMTVARFEELYRACLPGGSSI
jgi:alcohol dehydrogenase class IV